jgi:spore germination cell wall hydrolase CwlJ-like protein
LTFKNLICLTLAAVMAVGVGAAEAKGRKKHHRKHHRKHSVCSVPRSTDRDIMIRTVIGEAGNQSYQGKLAVAFVIKNRLESGMFGSSVREVVGRPKQFEPWGRRCRYLVKLTPDHPQWLPAMLAVNEALDTHPEVPNTVTEYGKDPTKGATHFANVQIVKQRKNKKALSWIARLLNILNIGDHLFGRGVAGSDLDKKT